MTVDPAALAHAVAEHATVLPPIEQATDDDLAVLGDVIGDARVVGVGEAIHFVAEAVAVQRRLIRYLAQRHGFTVVAAEFGFAEGLLLDRWVGGEGGDDDLVLHPEVPDASSVATRDRWRWLREYNAAPRRSGPLRFAGIDTPCGGGSLRPVLDPLIAFLDRVDPDAAPLARSAREIAVRFEALSHAGSAPLWAQLPESQRDALTTALARLARRADALHPLYVARTNHAETDLARRHLDVAVASEFMVEAIGSLFAGTTRSFDPSVRDRMMADTLLWHLDRLDPDERVVLIAHDQHLRKAPVLDDVAPTLVLGSYLADALGTDYRALALTHTVERAPAITMTDTDPHGFVVADAPVAPAPPTGVEGAVIAAGLGEETTLVPLAPLRGDPRTSPDHLGVQGAHVPTDVGAAFDAVINLPTATRTEHVGLY